MRDTAPQEHRTNSRKNRGVNRDVTELEAKNRFDAADLTDTLTALQHLRSQLHTVADAIGTHHNTRTWAYSEVKRINQLIDLYLSDEGFKHYTPNLAERDRLEERLLKARGIK